MASFSVRGIFRWGPRPEQQRKHLYEERITLWQAEDIDAAGELAEQEARLYARENDVEYLEYWQAYASFSEIDANGVEVFSLLRESDLEPAEYLDAFFDTGFERQSDA
jgi:hypothetical protein